LPPQADKQGNEDRAKGPSQNGMAKTSHGPKAIVALHDRRVYRRPRSPEKGIGVIPSCPLVHHHYGDESSQVSEDTNHLLNVLVIANQDAHYEVNAQNRIQIPELKYQSCGVLEQKDSGDR